MEKVGVLGQVLRVDHQMAPARPLPCSEVTDTSPSLGRRGSFMVPGTQSSRCMTAPTNQAGQLSPQFRGGLVRGAPATPRLAASTLGKEQESL